MRRPAAAWKRLGRDDCHPERRRRSRRSRRTSPDAEACGGVEAPRLECARVFRPSAPARQESASDLRKSGSQGSMGRCAHRPSGLWFAHQRLRLTKPTQIAGACGLVPRRACGGRSGRARLWSAAIGAGFVRLASGRRARPTCGRPQVHELRASVAVAARMDVFSTKRGKNFNLCGTPQNMTLWHIFSDLRFLRGARACRAANGRRRHRTRQEFQLVVPQVEILASLREKNRHAGARGRRTPRRRTGNGVRTAGARDGKACDAPAAAPPFGCKPASVRAETLSACENPGGQGSMNNYVHRPCRPWSVNRRVRLTKPPQIVGACGPGARCAAAGARVVATPRQRRLVQVSCGWPRVGGRARPAGARRCTSCEQAGRRPRPPPSSSSPHAGPGRRRGRPAAHFLRFVAGASARAGFVHIF